MVSRSSQASSSQASSSQAASARPLPGPETAPHWLAGFAAWCLLIGLVLAAGWFGVQRVQRGRATPTDEPLSAAIAILRAELREGDAMAFVPSWSSTQRWRFEALWRSRGLDYRAAWMPGNPVDSWDADGFKRLWILTTHDARVTDGPAGHAPPADRDGASDVGSATIGQLLRDEALGHHMKLLLYRLPASRTRLDLRARIADADVRRIGPKTGVEERCHPVGDTQRCKGDWWTNISSAMHEVGGSRRRCLFVQPYPAGATLRMLWTKVPVGEEIAGRVGNQLWAVRYDEGSDVRFAVRVGDEVRHTETIARGDFTWHRWRVPLRLQDRGKPIALEFSAADPAWRQLCVDARVLGRAKAPTP